MLIYGKKVAQPRLTAWYGDSGCTYSYSGVGNNPLPWTTTLADIRKKLEVLLDQQFNSVLLNYYRSGKDSIGFHSDDERELGQTPIIASLSYGTPRILEFQHKKAEHPNSTVELTSGSLLLMMGDTQKNWKHGIRKCHAGPRINLTYRQILI